MKVELQPGVLRGTISIVSSKSDAHRALICAALFGGAKIELTSTSADIEATARVLSSLGADIKKEGMNYIVEPIKNVPDSCVLDCGESGSTLRFLMPVAAALCSNVTFVGSGRLPNRPMNDMCNALRENGCNVSANNLPITIEGKLKSGDFVFPGNVSSQYISGTLFALPLLKNGGKIQLTSDLESEGYVDLTLSSLEKFGVTFEKTENGFSFSAKKNLNLIKKDLYQVEGDWSNAAFWFCSNFLGSAIKVAGLDNHSKQGDRKILSILASFLSCGDVFVDARSIPDLIPTLAVASCGRNATTYFTNCERLKIKESDRIKSTVDLIVSLGGNVTCTENSITVFGQEKLKGGEVDGANDHRIVMAASIASSICKNPVIIKGAEAVEKSYPRFFEDFSFLGGKVDVIDIR